MGRLGTKRKLMSDIYLDIFDSNVPKIMGIVNVTPDSFSDGGNYFDSEKASKHAFKLINEGADIIDIGGESTRPLAEPVNVDEELNRVIPVIKKIVQHYPDSIISVDTTKSIVAEEALKIGAQLINDVSGGTFDENMYNIVSQYDVPFVIMHIKGNPSNMQDAPYYDDVVEEICTFFSNQIEQAQQKGVRKIIVDPGIGFGKSVEDNFTLLNNLNKFSELGYPILLGLSKKSFLGKSLNLEITQRENATIVSETIGALNGASIIRTHNVENAVQMKKIIEFVNNSNKIIND